MLAALVAANTSGEELTFPSDTLGSPVAPTVTEPIPADINGAAIHGAAPLGPDATLLEGGPASAYASGQYYNPTLGAHLRARFNTRSYGQQQDTLDLGTMKHWSLDGGFAFVDGQVTLNDDSRVGYNVGVGYRWKTLPMFPWSPDDEKIMGVSVWSDGQSAAGDNFFSQIGTSFELLGDRIDFRANGYAPVGEQTQTRDFFETGEISFSGNSLAPELIGTRDTALTVAEAELAGRLANLDAWLFGGVYGFRGGQYDATGWKVGLRGYATPDLLLSIAIADDDEFDTNALFSATWFIGRTRAENCPTGTLNDRFREPVIRNDYIALQQDTVTRTGEPLIAADGSEIRIVHVDSTAPDGGDGSFESPLNNLDDIFDNSQEEDIILAHGGSDFDDQNAVLQNDQTFFGEGDGETLEFDTDSLGLVEIPETAPGAGDGPIPTIDGGTGAGVTLADNNTVQNLEFDGGENAIVSDAVSGSFNPNLQNLTISGTTGDAISLTTVVRADEDDLDEDEDEDETINVLGNVVINEVTFDSVGGYDIFIDGMEEAVDDADNNLGETITISDVASTGNMGPASIGIFNTTDTTGINDTITDYTYEGGTGGAFYFENTGSVISITESDIMDGSGPAIEVIGNRGTVSMGSSNTIVDITGDAIVVEANEASVTVDANVETDASVDGGTVRITANEATVNVGGDLESNNVDGVVILNAKADIDIGTSPGGTVQDGTLTHTGTGVAISITDDGTDPETADESVGITFESMVDNSDGSSVVIEGGNDTILFTDDIADTGEGIRISTLEEDAGVIFGPEVILDTTTSDALLLSGNDEDSSVDFQELFITTTTGRGLVSDGGELNIIGVDDDNVTSSTITTDGGKAIDITGGSSSTGLNFADVTTTSAVVGDEAIEVVDFDGTVTINDGDIESTVTAARFENSAFEFNGDEDDAIVLTSGTGVALEIVTNDDINRTSSLTNVDLDGGDVAITSSGSGSTTVDMTDVENGDSLTWDASGEGSGALVMIDTEFASGYAYTTAGDSSLSVIQNADDDELTGGPVSFTSSSSENSSLNIDGMTMATDFTFLVTGDGGLDVDLANIDSTGDVSFLNAGAGDSSLDINDSEFGGEFDFDNTGEGDLTVTMNTVTGTGDVTFVNSGEGTGTINIDDLETTGAFDYDANGDGNLVAIMNNVTGTGDVTLDVTSSGDGSVTMTDVNTGGAITATGSGASTGSLSVTAIDSGDTTNFTGITINQQGTGSATGLFDNVDSTSGIDFDSASDSSSSLTVTNGDYGGGIDFNETGDGSATLTITGAEIAGDIDFSEAGGGNAGMTLSSVEATGSVDFDAGGTDDATMTIVGGEFGGPIDAAVAAGMTGDFTVSITGGTQMSTTPQITLDAQNSGDVDFTLSGLSFNTGADLTAFDIDLGSSIVNADISITNNQTIITNDASVLDLDITSGTVNFELSGNNFQNNSGTVQTVLISNSGSSLNSTITNNTIQNNGAEDELLLTNAIGSSVLANVTNNGASGVNYELENLAAAGQFTVLGADATEVDDANAANIIFSASDANFTFDEDLVVPTP